MEKIKSFIESEKGKDILVVLIVILVGLGSFELGRLSKSANSSSSGVKIEYPNQPQNQLLDQEANVLSTIESTQASQNNEKGFFASNRGSKYYPVGCDAGKSLKQENRIYFNTREEAVAAGYELSSSCK